LCAHGWFLRPWTAVSPQRTASLSFGDFLMSGRYLHVTLMTSGFTLRYLQGLVSLFVATELEMCQAPSKYVELQFWGLNSGPHTC
jgi:hypothetical protein